MWLSTAYVPTLSWTPRPRLDPALPGTRFPIIIEHTLPHLKHRHTYPILITEARKHKEPVPYKKKRVKRERGYTLQTKGRCLEVMTVG
jgi:hypothetical protein